MRASIGGCVAKSAITPPLSVMPKPLIACGSSPGSSPPSRAQRIDHRRRACRGTAREPASARNSRWREKHATIIDARIPEHDLRDDHGDEIAGSGAAFGAEHGLVDDACR